MEKTASIAIVPLDYCANSIICSAWEVAQNRFNEPIIYNFSKSHKNPINWNNFVDMHMNMKFKEASMKVVWYPSLFFGSKNRYVFAIQNFFSNVILAIFIDTLLRLSRQKPRYVNTTVHEFNFNCDKLLMIYISGF